MERQRWLLAMGVVVGLHLMMVPSSIAQVSFLGQSNWARILKSELSFKRSSEAVVKDVTQSSQRQVNTISVARTDLGEPHNLVVETSADLTGQIAIEGEVVATLSQGTTILNIAPYLADRDSLAVTITGNYNPSYAAITLQLEGPNVLISQQSSGVGRLNYQLNLVVD